MVKTYKFRLYPTPEQEALMSKHFGCVRFIYNWALDFKAKYYKEHKKGISWMKISSSNVFFDLKKEFDWLQEVNSQSLISAIGNLDRAFKNFFEGRAKYPNFKKKGQKQSFQVPQNGNIDTKRGILFIPKFREGIECLIHRSLPKGKLGTFTVEKRPSGRYFVSVMVHMEEPVVAPKSNPENFIGLDFGLKTFITTSEGKKIQNPEFGKKGQKKLSKLQRNFSRKRKGGKNREKDRKKAAKQYEKITNQRQDFLHKLSHKFVNESQNDVICIEDLNLDGMKRIWGKKISDLSWFEFTRQLQYKCNWYGKTLVKIGRFDPSSKMCSKCGHIHKELDLSMREWTCTNCGEVHDRDVNAGKNIKDFGAYRFRLGQELSDVTPLEKKALAKKRKQTGETGFVELGKKKGRKYTLKLDNLQ